MKKVKVRNNTKDYFVGKIVCVGRNYAEHAKELRNEVPQKPVLFLKPSSAITYSGGKVRHPNYSQMMHHEVELVLLIGKTIKDADEKRAEEAIEAYGVGLDMTLRDVQTELKKRGEPWTIAKCFDNSAVISEFVSKSDYSLTLTEEISLTVNDELRQLEKLNKMIFSPAQIVEYISSVMTLEEGDLVFTGTPAGVNQVKIGDTLKAEISELVKLDCFITSE